jgi:hypothetical protein
MLDVFRKKLALTRPPVTSFRFYLFMKYEIEELFDKAGFAPDALYGDYEYTPFRDEISHYMIWRLKRRV